MAEVKWIKIVTDIFDDEKILLIESVPEADSIIVIWFKLLCLAGKQNNNGLIMLNDRIAYTDEMLSTVFRRPLSTVKLALATFESFGMIEMIDGKIYLPNWEKHQSADRMAQLREYNREAKQKSRARLAGRCQGNVNDMSMTCQGNVIDGQDTDIDIDIDKDIDKEYIKENIKRKNAPHFTPPTLEEVQAYCRERNNAVNAERFIDFYSSKGWMVGKNKMKDWKAAVRNWERGDKKSDTPKSSSFETDDFFAAALEKTYGGEG